MTPQDFTYWLQGFMEISDPKSLDEKQTQIIKDHLALVFKKETPDERWTKENVTRDEEWETAYNKLSWTPSHIRLEDSPPISC